MFIHDLFYYLLKVNYYCKTHREGQTMHSALLSCIIENAGQEMEYCIFVTYSDGQWKFFMSNRVAFTIEK